MTRSDGKYPEYLKLDIDPENSPGNYWRVGALECKACQKLWPNNKVFHGLSLCCNAEMTKRKDEVPDVTWREATKDLLYRNFEVFYAEWNEGVEDQQLFYLLLSEDEWKEKTQGLTTA